MAEEVVKRVKLDQSIEENCLSKPTYVVRDEKDIGIEEFLSNHKGFHGIIKKRYSDFIVHEITQDEQVVRLTSLDAPKLPEVEENGSQVSQLTLRELLSEDEVVALDQLFSPDETDAETTEKPKEVKIDVTDKDKEWRKKLHKSIAELYPGLFTNTKDIDGRKVMMISRTTSYRGKAWPFPADFTHFVLYQENKGTIASIGCISRVIQNNQKSYSYTGTKDKRACSAQRVCCYRLHPKRLLKVNDVMKKDFAPLAVGNITFSKTELKLGQSHGNHFQIVLRDVQVQQEGDIEEAFKQVKENGFINYFGSQRFGNGSVRTDRIGRFILQGDWKAAVEHILSPKLRDMKSSHGSFNSMMMKWQETKDSSAIYDKFFWRDSNEGIILRELSKDPNNYKNAIISLPRNNRHMYVHAYQSWIFNRVVSERIRRHQSRVLSGDLLLTQEFMDEDSGDQEKDAKNGFLLSEPSVVTEESLPSVSIYDVVIPIIGCQTKIPDNETGEFLKKLLEEDGVPLKSFGGDSHGFSINGGYRKMLIKPRDLSFEIVKYKDETIRLFQTDLDVINGVGKDIESFNEHDNDIKQAVKLEVSLPASCYATVFARELMRRNEADLLTM